MSILSAIKADFKAGEADVEKFAVEFEKLFKKAPSALQTVNNFVSEVAPIVIAADAIAAPETEPEVAAALAVIETGLTAIQVSAQAANSGQSLLAALQNFATTVPALLSGLAIKNPVLQATIEKIVTLVTSEAKVLIPAVEAWVAQIKAANIPAAK